VALALGIVCGVIIGSIFVIFIGSEPVVEFARSIPPVMAFPLFLVAFNYEESAYIWSIVFGCFPIMILAVSRGVSGISTEKLELLTVYRVRALVRWFTMSMEILPSVFLGARLTLTLALVIAVVTEMVFSPRSGWALGALARDSEIDFDTPTFYACVLIIGAFGFIANVALRKVEQRLDVQTVVGGNISGQ
jgi:ABC-type nitrate/sulfonate/bicarbonate transport system permease component